MSDASARPIPLAAEASLRGDLPILATVAAAACAGRLPALGAWWTLDDWGLLGRAAGLVDGSGGVPARWLSQHLWWTVTWPLCGLNADAHAVLRILMHAAAALLVVRLAARARVDAPGRLLAGLLFAATPLAFTPLVWAAGVQELLATVCALGAVLAWSGGSRNQLLLGAALAAAGMLAKEAALGLPVVFAALLWWQRPRAVAGPDRSLAWSLVLLLLLVAILESAIVLTRFDTSSGGTYGLGGPVTILGNLGVCGFWMISPGPIFASALNWTMVGGGGALFVLWAVWAAWAWRQGRRLPAAALLACLLALAPALPLEHQLKPYLAYLPAAAGVLAISTLAPRGLTLRPAILLAVGLLVVIGSFTGMQARLGNRNEMGLPADPVVRATSLSWQATTMIENLRWSATQAPPHRLVLLQMPVSSEAAERADRLGERFVSETELQRALGGSLGPNLVGRGRLRATWANALLAVPDDALVLCESGAGFRIWGPTPNALLYAALTDVAFGHFERARRHLVRAAALNDETVAFLYDEGQMIVPIQMVLEQKEAFVDWTVDRLRDGLSAREVGGLQDMFFNLLSKATGRPVAALTAGSRVLPRGGDAPADTTGAR